MTESVVVLGIARTAMGGMQGVFGELPAPQLGGAAIKGALEDANISPAEVTEVLMGCVLPAGIGQAPARQASLAAGIAKSVPTSTVNKVCGSGMKTVMMARDSLLAGSNKVVVAGGMENMSLAPYMLTKARSGYRLGHGELLDHMFLDGLQDAYQGGLMGNFAE
ncbi:MAG TPA: acetyl-CoA C-acetyltransferase, partial [Cellvibrionaceae bacterium]|nr:acetyl-CoA C-acetyltransferase [Cellvibrionaceae bacterium]